MPLTATAGRRWAHRREQAVQQHREQAARGLAARRGRQRARDLDRAAERLQRARVQGVPQTLTQALRAPCRRPAPRPAAALDAPGRRLAVARLPLLGAGVAGGGAAWFARGAAARVQARHGELHQVRVHLLAPARRRARSAQQR